METIFAESELLALHEKNRMKALQRFKLLNGLPKGYFSELAKSMAASFNTPISLVSLVARDRVSFPGNFGITNIEEIPRSVSLCSIALLKDHPTIYPDTLKEPELQSNPLITGEFGLRFYAGAPIITEDGYALGVVCLVDKAPRVFPASEIAKLNEFATMAMQSIKTRLKALH